MWKRISSGLIPFAHRVVFFSTSTAAYFSKALVRNAQIARWIVCPTSTPQERRTRLSNATHTLTQRVCGVGQTSEEWAWEDYTGSFLPSESVLKCWVRVSTTADCLEDYFYGRADDHAYRQLSDMFENRIRVLTTTPIDSSPSPRTCSTRDKFFGKFAPTVRICPTQDEDHEVVPSPIERWYFDPRTLGLRRGAYEALLDRHEVEHAGLSIRRDAEVEILNLFEAFHLECRAWTLMAGIAEALSPPVSESSAQPQNSIIGRRLANLRKMLTQELLLEGRLEPSALFMVDRYLAPGYLQEALRPAIWFDGKVDKEVMDICFAACAIYDEDSSRLGYDPDAPDADVFFPLNKNREKFAFWEAIHSAVGILFDRGAYVSSGLYLCTVSATDHSVS